MLRFLDSPPDAVARANDGFVDMADEDAPPGMPYCLVEALFTGREEYIRHAVARMTVESSDRDLGRDYTLLCEMVVRECEMVVRECEMVVRECEMVVRECELAVDLVMLVEGAYVHRGIPLAVYEWRRPDAGRDRRRGGQRLPDTVARTGRPGAGPRRVRLPLMRARARTLQ